MPNITPYKTQHLGLIFDFSVTPIAINGLGFIARDFLVQDIFNETIDIEGIQYTVKWELPIITTPIVGLAISRTKITSDLWNSPTDIFQANTIIHFDAYNQYPIQDELWYRNPIRLKSSETLVFGVFVENSTTVIFSKTVRVHITIFYKDRRI